MNRRELLSLSGALAAAALAGCTEADQPATETARATETGTEFPTESPTVTPTDERPSGSPSVSDGRLRELAAGNAAFALDLHRHLAADSGGNQFLSPYSISVALAMTFAGARGDTREQMRETLGYTLGEEVHPAFADLQAALDERATTTDQMGDGDEVDAFDLAVANALWGREDYPFSAAYLDLLDEHYDAGMNRADFTADAEGERERINDWVAEATEDRIDEVLPPGSIGPSTVLVLTNAVYFTASWLNEFDPENTEDEPFIALDGGESTVPMMRRHVRTDYASVPGAEAVELPYVGEDVSMVLILPDEGTFAEFERNLDPDYLFGLFEELGDAEGDLSLPRFEFETEVQLSEALEDMGMPGAFESGADFSGMVDGEGGPWIDDVYHDSYVSVDEEGTEAAASTAVTMIESPPPQWGELRFDRPFLFCIRDRPTDAILFLGRVVDAGAAQRE